MLHGKKSTIFLFVSFALAGCSHRQPVALGPKAAQASTIAINRISPTSKGVTIAGTMIDKCPVAGCWFHVKDSTGVIKVDTKNAGFVVTDVPVGSRVIVSGKPIKGQDGTISATHMTYQ